MKLKPLYLLISSAVLSTSVQASNADFSIYGSLRVMNEIAEHDNGDNVKDAASRIGADASYNFSDSLKFIAKYEFKVNVPEAHFGSSTGSDERQLYVGLAGDFGELKVGRYWSTFYNAVGYAPDQLWWNTAPVYYTLDPDFRIGDAIMYTTPDMDGLQISALHSKDRDVSQLAGTYKVDDSLKIAGGFIEDGDTDSFGTAFYYTGKGYYVNGMYMDKDNTGRGADIIGGITRDKSIYSVGVSTFDDETTGTKDFDALILAYQYNIHPKVKLWAEAWAWDGVLYGNRNSSSLNLGVNFDFNI